MSHQPKSHGVYFYDSGKDLDEFKIIYLVSDYLGKYYFHINNALNCLEIKRGVTRWQSVLIHPSPGSGSDEYKIYYIKNNSGIKLCKESVDFLNYPKEKIKLEKGDVLIKQIIKMYTPLELAIELEKRATDFVNKKYGSDLPYVYPC